MVFSCSSPLGAEEQGAGETPGEARAVLCTVHPMRRWALQVAELSGARES